MIGRTALLILAASPLAACGPPQPMAPERAAELCAERARNAAGPRGQVTVGANSNDGPFANAAISVSGDYLRGRDPDLVYRDCVQRLAGGTPAVNPELTP